MSDNEQGLMALLPEQMAILRKCRDAFSQAIQAKFNCMAVFSEADSFGSNSGVLRGEKRYSTKLSSGVEISVWKDDLTRHKVAAVVNAANDKLNHGGGLAQALSNAGGPEIQKWSDEYVQKYGNVRVGYAVLGPAGRLPCDHIIHAVGPCVSPNPPKWETDKAAPFLSDAVKKILEIVVRHNISSVAIPALSSGLFHFPRNLCADIIVKTIKNFDEHSGFHGKNLEIHLVNHDEPSVQEMVKATKGILDSHNISGAYSGAVKGKNQSMTSSPSNSFQFDNITLHLKYGCIEEEEVDVIVNTIATNCNLSQGEISKAILNKAGRKIQEEIYKKSPVHFSGGDLYVTKACGLKCKAVYHTALADAALKATPGALFHGVSECLRKAAQGYKSISIPAIGTGNLGFQRQDVARIMTEAVTKFAKHMNKLHVNFVVFPKDNKMMEAFENEMKRRRGEATSSEVRNDATRSFASAAKEASGSEMPYVEFQSVSKEAQREAKAWAFEMLKQSDNMTIRNNHVIYLDQRDHENLLSLQAKFRVRINEFFRNGNGGITITGSPSDVSCAAIEVESMLCKAQEDFAQAEERDILYSIVRWSSKDESWIQTPETSAVLEKAYLAGNEEFAFRNHKVNLKSMILVDNSGTYCLMKRTCLLAPLKSINSSFYARTKSSEDCVDKEGRRTLTDFGLRIVKVEKLENNALKQLFDRNGQRVKGNPKRLYQRVSAQYCDLICRVGFQKDFAPPAEQKYGSGIYFSSTLDGALKLWTKQDHEQYIYIIQAQVLTGHFTMGSQDYILPPSINGDPLNRYDSVSDMGQTYVIFGSQQALPECLIICDKSTFV